MLKICIPKKDRIYSESKLNRVFSDAQILYSTTVVFEYNCSTDSSRMDEGVHELKYQKQESYIRLKYQNET